jgi:hypothetical protein
MRRVDAATADNRNRSQRDSPPIDALDHEALCFARIANTCSPRLIACFARG